MAETAITRPRVGEELATLSQRRHWGKRLLTELLVLLLVLMSLALGGLILLDTAPGHRFIVDRLGQVETATGLRIRVGRIEGSIYGEARLKNVAVSDPQGVFLTSPEIIDWAPGAWLYNNLHIDELESPRVTLHRLPRLRKTGRKGPILPDFDIHIGRLKIDRLEVARGVAGPREQGACWARPTSAPGGRWSAFGWQCSTETSLPRGSTRSPTATGSISTFGQ